MTSKEFEPCPFCGYTGEQTGLTALSGHYAVQCGACEASGPWKRRPDDAETFWNARRAIVRAAASLTSEGKDRG